MADTNVLQAGRWLDKGAARVDIAHPDFSGPALGSTTATWDAAFAAAVDALDQTVGGVIKFTPGYTYLIDSINLSSIFATKAFASSARVWVDFRGCLLKKQIPADGGTAFHMFSDALGAADNIRWLCGSIDMQRAGFTAGNTVSAFFLDRTDNWVFYDPHIYDSIEEGIKAWYPRKLIVYNPTITNVRNNGIEVHAPLLADESYGGSKPARNAEYVRIYGGEISLVDDGVTPVGSADGEALVAHGTDTVYTVRDMIVDGLRVRDCLRGCWTEFNNVHGEGIHFLNIDHENTGAVTGAIHGSALIGCKHSSIRGGEYRNIGIANPGGGTETFGIIVSGSGSLRSEDCIVTDVGIRETRTSGNRTEYGIILRQCDRITVRNNRLSGNFRRKRFWVDTSSSPKVNGKFEMPAGDNRYKLQVSSSGQTIPNNAWTKVTAWNRTSPVLNAFGQDENNGTALKMVDSATANPERHGVNDPLPGVKRLTVALSFGANAVGQRGIRILRSGSVIATVAEYLVPATTGVNESSMLATVSEYFEVGDYYEVEVYQNSGGNLDLRNQRLCFVEYEHIPGTA